MEGRQFRRRMARLVIKLPKIPKTFFSALGPIAVRFLSKRKARKFGVCGRFKYIARRIELSPEMHITAQWVTLWHEAIHSAMTDAGAHGNTLTKEQEEVVCDAVGTYLTAMMLNGSLTVTSHRNKERAP